MPDQRLDPRLATMSRRSRRTAHADRRDRGSAHRVRAIVFGIVVVVLPAAAAGVAGWRACGAHGERCEQAGRFYPSYNSAGEVDLVMYDLTGDGIVETWVHRKDDAGIERIEIDRNEDGAIDRRIVRDHAAAWRVEPDAVAGRERR